jgi:hypothetical protein
VNIAKVTAALTGIVTHGETHPLIYPIVDRTNAVNAARKIPTVGSASLGTDSPGSGSAWCGGDSGAAWSISMVDIAEKA